MKIKIEASDTSSTSAKETKVKACLALLRAAIVDALERIDADDVVGAHGLLSAILGEDCCEECDDE